ncbi:angio-associated migratory cell protein [Trichogramma pretiosum]|uniref:angio-associated migratory cell protein n=1 Tax=Trichogramma pretiosum TaxID=7493 RepID=UPI0006C9D1FE|nr:angio-associated migratory cell protein [Trichogramma pretiosum]
MIQKETPPTSPYMDQHVEELEDDDLELIENGDVEVLDSYEVEEIEEIEDDEDQMGEPHENFEQMEREDASCIFDRHTASVFTGSLSKDGNYAVTGGEDDKAYVWNSRTGEIVVECSEHKDSVVFADFSHDDVYLATGDMNGIIKVRKTSDNQIIWDYDMGDALWMQWHHHAHVLLAGSVAGEVYMWKIPSGECKIIQGFGRKPDVASLMPDGRKLVVGYEDGTIRVIDLRSATVLQTISGNLAHSDAITCLDCYVDNNIILSGGVDGKVIVSTANTGRVHVLQNFNHNVDREMADANEESSDMEASGSRNSSSNWAESVAFMKDSSQQIAAVGTLKGQIFIWDVAREVLRHSIDQGSGVAKIIWKLNSPLIYAAGLDGILRCYDGRTAECAKTYLGHVDDILDLHLSTDGKRALTTSDDNTARIFEIE